MAHHQINTDYLIAGSGAVGMAFADVLLSESDATITIVDRYAKAGGHWNVAYPFVTLHQPSSFYGVSSTELSSGRIDEVGLNVGMGELATGAQVSAYFDDVMRRRFLSSGRVQYFPMCEYQGDGKFVSKLNGDSYEVSVARKTVDATFLKTSVPATHTPTFDIAAGVNFIPINDLPRIEQPPEELVLVGGGKTAIDACLWLLENGYNPDRIRWIMPRDAWLINRENAQPTNEFFFSTMGSQADQMEAIAQAESTADLFARLERSGVLLRLDPNIQPEMFHAATVSKGELAELRRVKQIVRMGRVKKLEVGKVTLTAGEFSTAADSLFVDCSASAIPALEPVPVFSGNTITPQTIRPYQPVFSAALIAHVEAQNPEGSDTEKNDICTVVPLPNRDVDWVKMQAVAMRNQYRWSQDKDLSQWILNDRLDGFSHLVKNIADDETEKLMVLQRLRKNAMPAAQNILKLLAELESPGETNA